MSSRTFRSLVLFLFLLAGVSPAQAHRLKVFATVVGDRIEGKAYFVGGGPAGRVSAVLRDRQEKVVAEGRTEADGRFALVAPFRTDLVVVVDAMDGHVARFDIAAARLPEALPAEAGVEGVAKAETLPASEVGSQQVISSTVAATNNAEDVAAAVARQIEPLAEQLDALESSIRIHDVLGGLGYIAGIFGLLAFLKSRRRPDPGPGGPA